MIFDSLVSLTDSFSSAVVGGTSTYTTATAAKTAFNSVSAKKRKQDSIWAPVVMPQKMNVIDLMFG